MCEVLDVILGDQCDSNMGGTKLKLHYANWSDFLVIQKPAGGATGSAKYKVVTAHTFKTGKAFKTIEITRNTGGNTIAPGGENSGTKSSSVVFRLPSNSDAGLVLFNMANGISPYLFLVEDANQPDGTFDQVGTDKHYATLTAQKLPGANDGEGGMYEFTAACTLPYRYLYTAAVTLTPAA
jgi:hypothetical protein